MQDRDKNECGQAFRLISNGQKGASIEIILSSFSGLADLLNQLKGKYHKCNGQQIGDEGGNGEVINGKDANICEDDNSNGDNFRQLIQFHVSWFLLLRK